MDVTIDNKTSAAWLSGGTISASIDCTGLSGRLILITIQGQAASGNVNSWYFQVDGNAVDIVGSNIYSSIGLTAMVVYPNPTVGTHSITGSLGTTAATTFGRRIAVYALSNVLYANPISESYVYASDNPTYTFSSAKVGGMTFATCYSTAKVSTWTVGTHEIKYLDYSYNVHDYSNVLTVVDPTCSANGGTERGYVCAAVEPLPNGGNRGYSFLVSQKMKDIVNGWRMTKEGLWMPKQEGLSAI